MAFGPFTLIRKNMRRRPGRSLLMVASIAIAFAIYAVLAAFEGGFNGAPPSEERLIVTSRVGGAEPLPIAMTGQIARLPGVAEVAALARLRAHLGEGRTFIGINAVEPERYGRFFAGRYDFGATGLADLATRRDGVLVGAALATRLGWQLGQAIRLTDTGGPGQSPRDWDFTVMGVFDGVGRGVDTNFVVARYDYVDAGRGALAGTVGTFGVLPAPSTDLDALARAIDARFANSANETRTQTENAYMKAFVAQFADVTTIVRLVVGAAFLTILMIVANTMVFVIRERRAEIGMLKVLGFPRSFILVSVLSETLWFFVQGLVLRLGLGWLAVSALSEPLGSIVPDLTLTAGMAATGALLALAFALMTGGLPAINAMRTPTRAALYGK